MEYEGEELKRLLALLRVRGAYSKLSGLLLQSSSLRQAFDAAGNCQIAHGKADWASVDKDLAWLAAKDRYLIHKGSLLYPPLLKEIQSSPPVLFVQGNPKLLSQPQIAMVGSRNPTSIGCETALAFAQYFSKAGFTVTSGLAVGIDAAAHQGALSGVGGTIGVLGSGLDRIYPTSHQALAAAIVEHGGALVSEFPTAVPPLPTHFPRRNRIISGLALGVFVVEATLNSGSLITAKYALEQGREVFAAPGSIHSPLAKGCHALIKQGAKLVEAAQDILEELGAFIQYRTPVPVQPEALQDEVLSSGLEALLTKIGYDCTPVDLIVARSGLTPQAVSSMLLELELIGRVTPVPGGYARAVLLNECNMS